jgi:signal recognition particle subunit SRP72
LAKYYLPNKAIGSEHIRGTNESRTNVISMGRAPGAPLALDTLDKIRQLRDAWLSQDSAAILVKAPRLLDTAVRSEGVQEAVYQIYVDALLQESQFERVLQIAQDKKIAPAVRARLAVARIYALYRLERYTEAQSLSLQRIKEGHSDATLQHIVAQSLYRTGQIKAAREAYEKIALEEDATTDTQIATNLVAANLANATPFCEGSTKEGLGDARRLLEQEGDYPSDLAYNLATLDLLESGQDLASHQAVLEKSIAQVKETGKEEDWSAAEVAQETAAMQLQLEWSRVFWQGGVISPDAPMKNLSAANKRIALVNRALDMKAADGLRLLPLDTSPLTPLQARLLSYNRAVLQYRASQFDECIETARHLQTSLSKDRKAGENGTTTHCAPDSKSEALWWEARATILQILALQQKGGKSGKSTPSLDTLLQTLQIQPVSAVRDHAIAYVQCHQAVEEGGLTAEKRLQLMLSLPESWQSKSAVVATLAALYQSQGHSDKAVQLCQSTGHEDVMADLMLSQGQYQQAVELYEQADLTDPVAQARYARALTFIDPSKAQEYWSKVRPSILDEPVGVDGAELEIRTIPRLRSSQPSRAIVTDVGEATTSKKKSHEAVLRQRAKKREIYLASLDQKGLRRATHPDPERWLPKYERSHNRRRKHKGGPHKGSQGGVSDKDAAQFDVAARQAARATEPNGTPTSTAHMVAVSSGGPRKGGRRR